MPAATAVGDASIADGGRRLISLQGGNGGRALPWPKMRWCYGDCKSAVSIGRRRSRRGGGEHAGNEAVRLGEGVDYLVAGGNG